MKKNIRVSGIWLFIYYKTDFFSKLELSNLRISKAFFTFLIFALNVAIQFCETSLDG